MQRSEPTTPAGPTTPVGSEDATVDTTADPDTLPHRASRQAFAVVPAPSGPVWKRRSTTSDAAAAIARQLFVHVNPAVPASYAKVLCPPIRHVFPPALLHATQTAAPLDFVLAESVVNGWPLFLQGAALGVGASVLAAEYARAFNATAAAEGARPRAAFLQVMPNTRSAKHLFDALALAVQNPLTNAELRFRSDRYIAMRIVAAAVQLGFTIIVLDHVGHLVGPARGVLAALLQALDPAYHVSLDGDPANSAAPRIGIVLVDHDKPERLFHDHPDAVGALQGRHIVLPPYTTVEQVGQALELADIGVAPGSFDPSHADDVVMATRILELTSGLAVQINPFLARLRAIASKLKARPNAAMVEAVLPYHRQMLELMEQWDAADGGRSYRTRVIAPRASRRPWLRAGSTDADHAAAAEDAAGAMRKKRRTGPSRGRVSDVDDEDAASARDHADPNGDTSEPLLTANDALPDDEGENAPDGATDDPSGDSGRRRSGPESSRARVLRSKRTEREKTERVARKLKRRGHTNP